jgi:hypothetical protein
MERVRNRLIVTCRAFATARLFGRSAGIAALLAGRMLLTGSTGKYRIKMLRKSC